MVNHPIYDYEEKRRLTISLQKLQYRMNELDKIDDMLLARAYDNPQEAEERMVQYVEGYGEMGLYAAIRERPELFGEYPQDKARFDDAHEARKQLPAVFLEYRKCRDDADVIQRTLNAMEREDPHREDDLTPQR